MKQVDPDVLSASRNLQYAWQKYPRKEMFAPSISIIVWVGVAIFALSSLWGFIESEADGCQLATLGDVLELFGKIFPRLAFILIIVLIFQILRLLRTNICRRCGGACEKRIGDYIYWVCPRCKIRWCTGVSPRWPGDYEY
jgi:hypothetical protein